MHTVIEQIHYCSNTCAFSLWDVNILCEKHLWNALKILDFKTSVTDVFFFLTILFCSPLPYQGRGTVYSGVAPTRSVAASTYGRNAYVWVGSENERYISHKCLGGPLSSPQFLLRHQCPRVHFLTRQLGLFVQNYVEKLLQHVHRLKHCIYNHNIKTIL